MTGSLWNQMEDWEEELDRIDWKRMLEDIDRALMDNLAAELGFPSFDRLEQASERVVDDFYVTHLSDGRWVWWSPTAYAKEDPRYFSNMQETIQFISDFLQLDDDQRTQLALGLSQVPQMRRCRSCEHEFSPMDPARTHWDSDREQMDFCSAECAAEFFMGEMREDFAG